MQCTVVLTCAQYTIIIIIIRSSISCQLLATFGSPAPTDDIPFLQLLCLVRPLSLSSNPQPLPVRKSAAAVHCPACASYETCIRRPFFSGGQVLASVARHSRTQQRHWCGCSHLVIYGRVATKIVAVYEQSFSAQQIMGQT